MSSLLDQPLDSIIQEKRKQRGPRNAGPRRAKGRGGRQQGRDQAKGYGPRRGRPQAHKQHRTDPVSEGRADGVWAHDMFGDDSPASGPRRNRRQGSASQAPRVQLGAKVLLTNVNFEVTGEQLKEMFADHFKVRDVQLGYDISGRPDGTATASFDLKADAVRAVDMFNGATIEDQVVTLALQEPPPAAPRRLRVSKRVERVPGRGARRAEDRGHGPVVTVVLSGRGGGGGRGSGGGRGGGRGRGGRDGRGGGGGARYRDESNRGGRGGRGGGHRNGGGGRGESNGSGERRQPRVKSVVTIADLDKQLEDMTRR